MKPRQIQNPANPVLLDAAFIAINTKMLAKLSWLTNAFGKAQTLKETKDKKLIKYPAVYIGDAKDYESVLPSEDFGNFCFWNTGDYDIQPIVNQTPIVTAPFGLIFWFNINTSLDAAEKRNIEKLKKDVLDFLATVRHVGTRITVTGITDNADAIYKEYTIDETKQQFLMHPFGAFRINGEIRHEALNIGCSI